MTATMNEGMSLRLDINYDTINHETCSLPPPTPTHLSFDPPPPSTSTRSPPTPTTDLHTLFGDAQTQLIRATKCARHLLATHAAHTATRRQQKRFLAAANLDSSVAEQLEEEWEVREEERQVQRVRRIRWHLDGLQMVMNVVAGFLAFGEPGGCGCGLEEDGDCPELVSDMIRMLDKVWQAGEDLSDIKTESERRMVYTPKMVSDAENRTWEMEPSL